MKPIDMLGFGPKRSAALKSDGIWHVTVVPPAIFNCGPGATIALTPDQYQRYQAWNQHGGSIQEIMFDLSPAQCEILMTGIGPDHFPKDEQDDDQ